VILATNVAETSLTSPGVTAVVDSGLVRLDVFDPRTGIDRLETRRVSADSAEQRAGRAGRTGPGTVFRLWSRGQQKELLPSTPPEIRRVDLSRMALELAAWGADPKTFEWFEPPEPAVIEAARELLRGLGALGEDGRITALGKKLAALPLHPRTGRLVIEAHSRGFLDAGALIAAILSERDIFRRSLGGGKAATVGPSDVLLRYDLLAEGRETGSEECANGPDGSVTGADFDRGAVSRVQRVRRELQRIATAALGRAPRRQPAEKDLLRLVLCAYPDRVVRRRDKGGDRGVMSGGRGVRLAPRSVVRDAEFFVAVDLDGAGADARVHLASAIDPDWLELTQETVLAFDTERERVSAVRRGMYRKLCVREAAVPPDPEQAARVLAEAAAADVERALKPSSAARNFMTRVECLREWMPELDLPVMDTEFLESLLPELCTGARGFDDLRRADLAARLKGALSHEQLTAVERHAPERIAVPSGSMIRLDYKAGRAPILAVQLQNLFGLSDTPAVAGGRVRVLLHLLAPSRRPVQVTQDLASFWKNTYAQVRKDLRARYPKHAWPEDPLAAAPESRPRRRKGGR
jgi:ATP-dependent helicase HrpB